MKPMAEQIRPKEIRNVIQMKKQDVCEEMRSLQSRKKTMCLLLIR